MHPLNIKFSSPLEREYEAWIVQGIEKYFHSLGQKIAIWSVSPIDEVHWPADEHLVVGKKLIGLQFKKVEYKANPKSPNDFGRLNWKFHNPAGQFDLVLMFPEIYYCLPTFVNRDLRSQAIHHCLFWRPEHGLQKDLNAWYNNPKAQTPYKSIGGAPRWGLFIEEILGCKVGKKINSIAEAKTYLDSIRAYMKSPFENETSTSNQIPKSLSEYSLFVIALPYQS